MNIQLIEDPIKEELAKRILDQMEAPQPKEKHLTRQQRRYQERIGQEAKETNERLAEQFLIFFSTHPDPEGQEVQDKIKQISAQWRLYCSRRQLNAKAFHLMDQYMDSVLKEYLESKLTNQII